MPTLKELRLQAHLSVSELSRLANVDYKTMQKAETGEAVQASKAAAIVDTLAERLGREVRIEDVEGLRLL